ncbi:low molecular weight protein-tyrosine-phosphatase [Actinocorallia lasiicapitis]
MTFVCTGNICRSPMAEHVLRRFVVEEGLEVEVDSSGTGGWHAGDPADPRTVAALRRAGYSSAHEAKQFRPLWFTKYDLIIALDEGHQRDLRSMAPNAEARDKVRLLRSYDPDAADLNVPDPYYGGRADFEEVREQIEAAVPGLLEEIRARLKEQAAPDR